MAIDLRAFAVATAGFASFVNLCSPQALLPQPAREFHVGAGEISALMTANPDRQPVRHLSCASVVVPWVGRGIALFGRRRLVLGIIAAWIFGALLMLLPPVTLTLTGLTLCAVCGRLCQTVATIAAMPVIIAAIVAAAWE